MKNYVISSGHGANVSGAKGYVSEFEECKKIATEVHKILQNEYVSKGWLYVEKTARTQQDNLNNIIKFHNSKTRTLDVAIHLNSSSNKNATGVEVFHYDMPQLANKFSKSIANTLNLKDRGGKLGKQLQFVWRTTGSGNPKALLIECFFLTNIGDVNNYKLRFNSLISTIAKLIADHLGYKKKTNKKTYKVETGDTLYKIGKMHNMTSKEMKDMNPQIKNYDIIRVGDIINVK